MNRYGPVTVHVYRALVLTVTTPHPHLEAPPSARRQGSKSSAFLIRLCRKRICYNFDMFSLFFLCVLKQSDNPIIWFVIWHSRLTPFSGVKY